MKKLIAVMTIVLIFSCHKAYSEDGYITLPQASVQSQHDWNHFGNAFVVQTISYGIYRKAIGMDKVPAFLFSLTTTFIFTTVYSLNNDIKPAQMPHEIAVNMLGAAASAGTCLVFDF